MASAEIHSIDGLSLYKLFAQHWLYWGFHPLSYMHNDKRFLNGKSRNVSFVTIKIMIILEMSKKCRLPLILMRLRKNEHFYNIFPCFHAKWELREPAESMCSIQPISQQFKWQAKKGTLPANGKILFPSHRTCVGAHFKMISKYFCWHNRSDVPQALKAEAPVPRR